MGNMNFFPVTDGTPRLLGMVPRWKMPRGGVFCVLETLRKSVKQSLSMMVWFCCVLSLMVMGISSGWAAMDSDWMSSEVYRYPHGVSEEDLDESIVMALAGPLETEKGSPRMKNKRFILSFMVHTRPEEEPEGIEEILEEAVERIAMDNPGILLNPAPVIGFSGIREHAAGGYVAQYEIMVSIKDYEHRKEPDGTSREQPRGPEEVRITDGASDDKLEFGTENRTDLVESPDPSDEVAKALEKQYPNTRRLRFVSDQPVPCQQAPRKLLGLYRGDKKLVEALPNPPHRNYAKISVSGIQQPQDSLFQVVEFLTASS